MKTTIKDIAEASGVSVTTVSLILNNKKVRTSAETKRKVLDTAQRLNYIPNSLAKGLITKRTNTIGLIVPDISNVFFSQMAKSLENRLVKMGYSLFLCDTNDSDVEQSMYLQLMLSHGIDALVLCIANDSDKSLATLQAFEENGIPVVAFDRYADGMKCPLVATDNEESARALVQYLVDSGHKRIACISEPNHKNYSSRLAGYRRALADNGLEYDAQLVRAGDYRYESGYTLAGELLACHPTAIFACNDMMAYGVYKAVAEMGLKIPDEISVVGFDDLMFSETLAVALTTVKQDIDGMCDKICSLVSEALDGTNDRNHYMFAATTVYRDSVKRL